MTVPDTMTAAVVETPDGPFNLVDMPLSQPGPGQVLVQIKASGVNPLDLKIRAGAAPHARQPLPAILGLDLAGVVVALGQGVTAFSTGDAVFGMTGGVGGLAGSLAQYAAVDADLLAHKPANLSFQQAAVLPLTFITAWEGLIDRVGLTSSQTVLVQGGAGGVGQMAIQIARARGAKVAATGEAGDADYIRGLGAEPIDHRREAVADYVTRLTGGQGFDVVYDTVGGEVLDRSFAAVAQFGHVVSCLGWGAHSLAPLSFKGGTYSGVFTLAPLLYGVGRDRYGRILEQARLLTEEGRLTIRLHPTSFTLETLDEAYDASRLGAGKVVIDVSIAPIPVR
jgi:NADPH2:quinone reductase